MSDGYKSLESLLEVLTNPKAVSAKLGEFKAAAAEANAAKDAAEKAQDKLAEAKHQLEVAEQKHDDSSRDTDKRFAARLVEVEAREVRAAKVEAEAQEHLAKAKAIRTEVEERFRKFSA